ncbi:MAG: acyl-CoA reductase [Bacteroidota bacterium]
MNLSDRVKSFEWLGECLRRYHENSQDPHLALLSRAAAQAYAENGWFTPEHTRIALNSLGEALQPENLAKWIGPYEQRIKRQTSRKRVGVVMAGNIPAVGFHDFLSVLLAGHQFTGRLSTSDARLIPAMASMLAAEYPEWQDTIAFTDGKLENFDAVIATGSDNTSRYFNFYFGRYPSIIRGNRNSIAILDGGEDEAVLQLLADDIMLFFGMGCRSVSKIFIPEGYDFSMLIKALQKYAGFVNHHKYCNNYDYNKSIFLVSQTPFIDAGCLLLKEDRALASRIAVLNYEYCHSVGDAEKTVASGRDSIQCVVSAASLAIPSVKPGEAQRPALWDYADEVDTLDFLLS